MYGQPRVVHEEEKARHHRGAADEGAGPGGEAPQKDGEVRRTRSRLTHLHWRAVLLYMKEALQLIAM